MSESNGEELEQAFFFLIKISCIQNKRTNEKILWRQEHGVYVMDFMVALPQSTDPHFHRQG